MLVVSGCFGSCSGGGVSVALVAFSFFGGGSSFSDSSSMESG